LDARERGKREKKRCERKGGGGGADSGGVSQAPPSSLIFLRAVFLTQLEEGFEGKKKKRSKRGGKREITPARRHRLGSHLFALWDVRVAGGERKG